MPDNEITSIGLFRQQKQAQAAVHDLVSAGVATSSISIQNNGPRDAGFGSTSLEDLELPEREHIRLREGVRAGGVLVTVEASTSTAHTIKHALERNQAAYLEQVAARSAKPEYGVFTQQRGVIELSETAEKLVVTKAARVVEEVRVGKTVRQRTEQIHDTVRRGEVAVESLNPAESTRLQGEAL